MLETISRPLPPPRLLMLSVALVVFNTAYCLAYTALAGHGESVGQAIGWSVANLLPWLWAFEIGKRTQRPVVALIFGFVFSILFGAVLLATDITLFEVARRLPGAVIVFALLLAIQRREVRHGTARIELPIAPGRIAWVAAAGNYVELHGGARPMLIRAPLGAIEAMLAPHGFVRIHRSTLVNRRRVARVRSVDLLLDDGRSLKLGRRFKGQFLG